MESEAKKLLTALKDRRTLRNPAEVIGDYWPTYFAAAVYGLLYWWDASGGILHSPFMGTYILFLSMVTVALTAVRDGKKEIHRKLEAVVRRLEEKELLGD